jgi:hypothetical protein
MQDSQHFPVVTGQLDGNPDRSAAVPQKVQFTAQLKLQMAKDIILRHCPSSYFKINAFRANDFHVQNGHGRSCVH